MGVVVNCSGPEALLRSIYKAIDEGHVRTWICDKDGDFTHEPEQWRRKAWLRPVVAFGALKFGLLGPTGVLMTKPIYGVYHGRFIEMLLTHFDADFTNVFASACGNEVDRFQTRALQRS